MSMCDNGYVRYILAISGGVDSVVLFDLMLRTSKDVVVAHFDHGIRGDSEVDARFVAGLAKKHGVQCIMRREELGLDASEELARNRRYHFLQEVADDFGGVVVTAHHRDDIVETIALNIHRGTRWRGLSGMSNQRILRPLGGWTKRQIYDYALKHSLEWVEDETNRSQRYKRNVMRRRINQEIDVEKQVKLYDLWRDQQRLRREIEQALLEFEPMINSRYFLSMIPDNLAQEIIYGYVLRHENVSLLRGQLERAVIAIKTAKPGTTWQIGGNLVMKMTMKNVTIERVD